MNAETHWIATVDSIDESIVVLDVDGHALRLPRTLVPASAREGDALSFTVGIANDETAARRAGVEAKLRALTKK
jgi:hypothetical protein